MANLSNDHSQNGHGDHSQIDHLTEQAEQNKEQKRLTDHGVAISNGHSSPSTPITWKKEASVLSHKRKAKKQQGEQLSWKLSPGQIEDLEDRFPRLNVKELIRPAAAQCQKKHPEGGPMQIGFFEAYLKNCESDLDPPGLIEGRRFKREEMKPSIAMSEIGQPALRQLQEQDQAPARDLPVSSARSQPLVGRNFPVRQPVTDPEEQLAVWKAKCPELADRFEQLALELQSRQSDWDGAAFDKVCGRLFDQYLRSERS